MARLRPKLDPCAGMMPADPAAAVRWWTERILTALRTGQRELVRPRNSNQIVELIAMSQARAIWETETSANKEPQ